MISRITMFRKRSDMDSESFGGYMDKVHAEKCLAVPGIYGYEQNLVLLKEKGDAYSEDVTADAITIERFKALYEYEKAVNSKEYKAVEADIPGFAEYSEAYVCLENVSIPLRPAESYQKKITLLGRTEEKLSFEDYTREWLVVHSGCMLNMPADVFFGYNQHLIIDRLVNGEHVSYERLPSDGILELYYSEAEAVAHAFAATPEGQMTVAHRKEFMSRVNPFRVRCKVFK